MKTDVIWSPCPAEDGVWATEMTCMQDEYRHSHFIERGADRALCGTVLWGCWVPVMVFQLSYVCRDCHRKLKEKEAQ